MYDLIIPAAGRGTRLGLPFPKLFADITHDKRVIDHLLDTFNDATRCTIVLSPAGLNYYYQHLSTLPPSENRFVTVQNQPTGMGAAVLYALPYTKSDYTVVIWGDQAGIKRVAFDQAFTHFINSSSDFLSPHVKVSKPYVSYNYSCEAAVYRLTNIKQSRDLELPPVTGLTDCGLFIFRTQILKDYLRPYLDSCPVSPVTGEKNFLPFLVYISELGKRTVPLILKDLSLALGINTVNDLAAIKQLHSS
jgi:bifunctional N-acetylglucosamine-1-phosphate-uridyltransferase/glucosamine-1-phosphate-acetyltransferase GlmU-like protein